MLFEVVNVDVAVDVDSLGDDVELEVTEAGLELSSEAAETSFSSLEFLSFNLLLRGSECFDHLEASPNCNELKKSSCLSPATVGLNVL